MKVQIDKLKDQKSITFGIGLNMIVEFTKVACALVNRIPVAGLFSKMRFARSHDTYGNGTPVTLIPIYHMFDSNALVHISRLASAIRDGITCLENTSIPTDPMNCLMYIAGLVGNRAIEEDYKKYISNDDIVGAFKSLHIIDYTPVPQQDSEEYDDFDAPNAQTPQPVRVSIFDLLSSVYRFAFNPLTSEGVPIVDSK